MRHGAGHHAQRQPAHANVGAKPVGRGDDRHVVEHGRSGRRQKVLRGVERAHHQPAGAKDHRAEEHDAHQLGSDERLFRAEAGRQQIAHDRLGEKGRQRGHADQHQHHQVENARKEQPGVAFVLLQPERGEDRQEGAAQRTAGHELKEHVGHAEGRQISVVGGARAEAVAEDDLTQQPGGAAEHEEKHHQQRRAHHAPAVQADRRRAFFRLFALHGCAHGRDYRIDVRDLGNQMMGDR
jgi:hypothetical protein